MARRAVERGRSAGHRAGCLLGVALGALAAGACREKVDDPGVVTRTSMEALEDGQRKFAAGDYVGAREAFTAAAEGGGLQPDFYCEARLQEAACAARLGDHAAAFTLLDELARGAPDVARVEEVRAFVRSLEAARSAADGEGDPDDLREGAGQR